MLNENTRPWMSRMFTVCLNSSLTCFRVPNKTLRTSRPWAKTIAYRSYWWGVFAVVAQSSPHTSQGGAPRNSSAVFLNLRVSCRVPSNHVRSPSLSIRSTVNSHTDACVKDGNVKIYYFDDCKGKGCQPICVIEEHPC